MSPTLILTYHAIEAGSSPLCVEPELFREHLDCIAEADIRTITVGELVTSLRLGVSTEQSVVLTFDDGFASVAEAAAPLLAERGMTATVFCVAGHLGGRNDWASARSGGFESRLADTSALGSLVQTGFEIGSHGAGHAPLVTDDEGLLARELVESRRALETALGVSVCSYAYPYGAGPSPSARDLVEATYAAACTARLGTVGPATDVHALPRVDAHYLRRPQLLRRALDGSLRSYLRARGLGGRARRAFRRDYARVA